MDHKPESRELAVVSQAERALAAAQSDEILHIRDLAEVARKLVKTKRLGEEAAFRAASVRVRADRKLGEFVRSQSIARAAPGNQHTGKLDRSSDSTCPIWVARRRCPYRRSFRGWGAIRTR